MEDIDRCEPQRLVHLPYHLYYLDAIESDININISEP
jgi:hypothetical protein